MINTDQIIHQLDSNKKVFSSLLSDISEEVLYWKPAKEKWNLLEIICHLYDEEREDFRLKHVLDEKEGPLPPAEPLKWVTERNYNSQNFNERLNKFLEERDQSISWLKSLINPKWDAAFVHPKMGPLTAYFFLINWLAHDYLHFRQITKQKYDYLLTSGIRLDYAGEW